jgi:hypothetical protein
VLLLSALSRVPWPTVMLVAVVWGLVGLGGVAYELIVARRLRRQAIYQPVFEDWLFHFLLPMGAHLILLLSAFVTPGHTRVGLFGVGAAALLLLFSGIHNAWDAVTYHVFFSGPDRKAERR